MRCALKNRAAPRWRPHIVRGVLLKVAPIATHRVARAAATALIVVGSTSPAQASDSTSETAGVAATAVGVEPKGPALRLDATAGIVASVGVAPAPAVGAALGATARWRVASLGLEGRFDAASSAPIQGGGSASSSLVLVSLVACGHSGPVFGCGLVQAGQMRAGEAPNVSEQSAPWWAVGGRIGIVLPVGGDRTGFRLRSDLLGNLAPQTLTLNGLQAWKAPRFSESLGADVVIHFL